MKAFPIIFPADTRWRQDQDSRTLAVAPDAPLSEPPAESNSPTPGEEIVRLFIGTIILFALVLLY